MKLSFPTALLVVCGLIYACIAQEWIQMNPSFDPPGNYDMSHGIFVNENKGWFAETRTGRIWNTIDGGLNWVLQRDSTDVWIHDIKFLDTLFGWITGQTATGDAHFIWRTTDGGGYWEELESPDINALWFFDSLDGFGGGDSIYLTDDGGVSWTAQELDYEYRLRCMGDFHFIDREHGWAVSPCGGYIDLGIILSTQDSGRRWTVNTDLASVEGVAVYFTNRLHGCVVGSGWEVVMVTYDGGESWIYPRLGTWPDLTDVAFIDDSTGWAIGYEDHLWHTTDGGSSWEKIELNTNADLRQIVFVENNQVGYIFGSDNTLLRYVGTVSTESKEAILPTFYLYQNYPNPFNRETVIMYDVSSFNKVTLTLYDLIGTEMITLVDQKQAPGSYSISWNGKDQIGRTVNSGIYFCSLKVGSFSQAKKMVLIR